MKENASTKALLPLQRIRQREIQLPDGEYTAVTDLEAYTTEIRRIILCYISWLSQAKFTRP